MRILHVVHQFAPHFVGGTELYTASLAEQQVAQGHEVAVFVPIPKIAHSDPFMETKSESGYALFQVPVGERSGQQVFQDTLASSGPIAEAFTQAMATYQPDIVHIQHLMGLPISAIDQTLSGRQCKVVVTLHDFWWICANAQRLTNYDQTLCEGPSKLYLNCGRCAAARAHAPAVLAPALAPLMVRRNRSLARLVQRADRVIAASNFVANWHTEGLNLNRPIEVAPLGIDTDEFNPRPAKEPAKNLELLYVGGLSLQKGVHIIIEAVKDLPNVTLSIIGDESKFPSFVMDLKQRQINNVVFKGKLPPAQVKTAMATADLLLIPSIWYEAFGLVLSEAFAIGLPVMVSDLGALAERVTDGVNGFKVRPGDTQAWREAIQRVNDNRASLQRLKQEQEKIISLADHSKLIESLYSTFL